MSSLPTLLKENVIIPHMNEKKNQISNIRGIDYIMNWFKDRIDNPNNIKTISDKIVILKSATGSGKSTVFPTEFYLRFFNKMKKNIIVTQPRILTTISIPKDIANEPSYKLKNRTDNMGIELYKNIGYQTKEYIKKPLEKGILFCTIGILLQFLKNMDMDIFLNKYGCIIIDEAHERTTNLDLIFYYTKSLFNKVPIEKCPFLIIASATMNVEKYAKYYNTKTIFEIIGTSYPIEVNYLKYDSSNIYDSCLNIIKQIHINNPDDIINKSDIIIFIPTQSYISKLKNKILELNNELKHKLYPIALDSQIFKSSDINYQSLFEDLNNLTLENNNKATRKVIISTNIAETGITINSLKYCIDIGLVNQLEYNPIINSNILIVKPATKSMVLQRKGRVGRKQPGIFEPIFTEDTFNNMIDIQYPEIYTENLTLPLLSIIIVNNTKTINKYIQTNDLFNSINNSSYDNIKFEKNIDIYNLDLLDNPTNISINNSLYKLYVYGAIYGNGYPTKIGLLINKIRNLSIENIMMILSGYNYDCNILDLITIASYIQIGKNKLVNSKFKSFNIQFNNIYNDDEIDNYNYNKLKTRLFISCEFIDFLLFFYKFKLIMDKYKSNITKIIEFCDDNKVNYKELLNLLELREEIIKDMLFNMNLNPYHNSHINLFNLINMYNNNEKLFIEGIEEIINIKKCIYNGYKLNVAQYNNQTNNYISLYNNMPINLNSYLIKNLPIFNNGQNFDNNKPEYILYSNLTIKKNSLNNNYELFCDDLITVLSGYINIDKNIY
jgi:HrpA-like RNA helicase